MTARKELIAAISERYRVAPKVDKVRTLDEFALCAWLCTRPL